LARVRRRLFLQTLLHALAAGWAAALAAACAWFLALPHLLPGAAPWQRWAAPAAALGVATLAAAAWALRRRPTLLAAALALDERFGLRERATTAATLGPDEVSSPAGRALLADADARVGPLTVRERFPVRPPRAASLVPLLATGAVLAALFYRPAAPPARHDGGGPLAATPEAAADVEQKMRALRKKETPKPLTDKDRSAELRRMDAELDRLAQAPHDTRDEAREVVKEMTTLEDQMRKRTQELAGKADALQEQVKQVERLSRKANKDRPDSELNKALARGDLQKARDEMRRLGGELQQQEEVERLKKKVADKSLSQQERDQARERLGDKQPSKEQQEKLREQVQDLRDRLERLSRNKGEQEDWLRDLARKGEIDPGQLGRELDQLEKSGGLDADQREALRELARQLGECERCMKEGQDGEAARRLAGAGDKLAELDGDGEQQALGDRLRGLREAKGAVCRALDGQPVPAAGRRPESRDGATASEEKHERSQMDRGRLQVVDHVPGQGFKGPRKPAEMAEEIRQAAQEAPEAIDRQRLPRSAKDMARGFFENLRGDKGKKP
jgi:hypothetical protein